MNFTVLPHVLLVFDKQDTETQRQQKCGQQINEYMTLLFLEENILSVIKLFIIANAEDLCQQFNTKIAGKITGDFFCGVYKITIEVKVI
jgi:hypothetical protein